MLCFQHAMDFDDDLAVSPFSMVIELMSVRSEEHASFIRDSIIFKFGELFSFLFS